MCLKGERFDAHDYVAAVYQKGARAFVINETFAPPALPSAVFFRVKNTLFALGAIARYYRRRFPIPVIAVTGSAGKTTVKELIALFLSVKYRTLKTEGNFNNEVGVPKTLFSLTREHEIAVVECGMNHAGELERLSALIEPDAALITNVSAAHIEFFDSVEAIAYAKAEIFSHLKNAKIVFMNTEDEYAPLLINEARRYGAKKIVSYSRADITALNERSFVYNGGTFTRALPGTFNVMNILAALTVAQTYGVPLTDARDALAQFKNAKNRMNEFPLGAAFIIDDTYNSNPRALKEALSYLASKKSGRRIAVVGDMLELGSHSKRYHEEIASYIETLPIDSVYTFGEYAKATHDALSSSAEKKHFSDMSALVEALEDALLNQAWILIKGSRGVRLDEAITALKERAKKSGL